MQKTPGQIAEDNFRVQNPKRLLPCDQKCFELAVFFLKDLRPQTLDDAERLASKIQQTIENFLAEGGFEDA